MSKLYRILIVEDEEIERSALSMMLRYNRQDIDEVCTAENGVQALDIFRQYHPDIVFMDINLPGINGLDIIRQMKRLPGSPRFVIISAHSQFAYAQEAMRLDVHDFLVKPVSLEDITGVLDSLTQEIDQSRSQYERAASQQEKFDVIRPVLESDCVLSVASLRATTPIDSIFDFMQISVASGFVFVLRGEGVGGVLMPEIKARMRNMGIHCIAEMINDTCVCIALSPEQIQPQKLREIMQHLSNTLLRDGRTVQIGVGSIAGCADDLRRSYEQAMASVSNTDENDLTLSGERSTYVDHSLEYIAETASKISYNIRSGQKDMVLRLLQNFLSGIPATAPRGKVQEQAYWMYVMVISNFPEYAPNLQILSAEQIFAMLDTLTLRDAMTRSFLSLMDLHNGQDIIHSNQIVSMAIKIIKQQYQNDITLDNVAETLNVSLFYLSKLFRKHTGTTFTEFLTQIRVEHAKELLQREEMSVKEVAYATGFNSQGYFSKIFKKYTGFAPSEFKEQLSLIQQCNNSL